MPSTLNSTKREISRMDSPQCGSAKSGATSKKTVNTSGAPQFKERNMVNEEVRRHDDTGGLTSLLVSMIELGDAATRFTFNQMQNAVDIFVNPVRVIDRTRDSMNNFS